MKITALFSIRVAKSVLAICSTAVLSTSAVFSVANASAGDHPTTFLPSTTLVYVGVPDVNQVWNQWGQTDLSQIFNEPTIQQFFAKGRAQVSSDSILKRDKFLKLQPRNLFLALLGLEPFFEPPQIAFGFQYTGSKSDIEALLADTKREMTNEMSVHRWSTVAYFGDQIEVFSPGPPQKTDDGEESGSGELAYVYHNNWFIAALNVKTVQTILDQMRGGSADNSLSGNTDYQAVKKQLPRDGALLTYIQIPPIVHFIIGESSAREDLNKGLTDALDKLRGLGIVSNIDKGKFRDTWFLLAPGWKESAKIDPLDFNQALKYTTNDTLIFATSSFIPPMFPDGKVVAAGRAGQRTPGNYNADPELSPDKLRSAFVLNLAASGDWSRAALFPTFVSTIPVKNQSAAQAIIDRIISDYVNPKSNVKVDRTPINGFPAYTFNSDPNVKSQGKEPGAAEDFNLLPTIAITPKTMFLAARRGDLTPESMQLPVGTGAGNAINLGSSPTFQRAKQLVGTPDIAFGYIDTRTVFEQIYGRVTPFLAAAAAMSRDAAKYIDTANFPKGEVIAKHLSPIVFSERWGNDGIILESVGPITQPQLLLGAAVGIVAGGHHSHHEHFQTYDPGADEEDYQQFVEWQDDNWDD